MKIVPDTSVIIDGRLSEMIEKKEIKEAEIIIPQMVIDELQSQAGKGLEIGWDGLNEIKKLRGFKNIKVNTSGRLPTAEEISMAKKGRIDALIRLAAREEDAILYTADMVQAEVGEADGVEVVYLRGEKAEDLLFEKYLDDEIMSLHLKEGTTAKAKKGQPGNILLTEVDDKLLTMKELNRFADNIVSVARHRDDGHMEMSMRGAEIIQLGQYRISITRPPFSKDIEITVVRPLVKLALEDYKPSDKLMRRLGENAEGVLVAGPPGSGKTTFVQSVAEFYLNKGKIVKTMESPRDLNLPKEITQYSPLNGRMENTADVLLLVRPDYTIYDELRKTHDFRIFADMRLAGVGMVGVTHATKPVDAVQRFIGRMELGVIPHVVDTIIFVKAGKIDTVYSVDMLVKVPTGMKEQDLARPVIEIRDFEGGKLEYEIYSYGEENVVIPVQEEQKSALHNLAEKRIKEAIRRYDRDARITFVNSNRVKIELSNEVIPKFIGKNGSNIEKVEKELGISIDVQPAVDNLGTEVQFNTTETGAYVVMEFKKNIVGENASIYVNGKYLFTATVGKSAQIRIGKGSDIGKDLVSALTSKKKVSVFI